MTIASIPIASSNILMWKQFNELLIKQNKAA